MPYGHEQMLDGCFLRPNGCGIVGGYLWQKARSRSTSTSTSTASALQGLTAWQVGVGLRGTP